MSNIQKTTNQSPVLSYLQDDGTKTRFQQVLGAKAPQFIASIISATQTNTKLLECKPESLTGAALIAATLDLPINASLGMAYLVPYRSGGQQICQFQIGWKGLVQLAIRTGQYKTINVTEVYEGQLVDSDPFTGEYTFSAKAKTSNKVIGYVAYFKLLTGFEKQYYWTVEECEAHAKKYSKSYTGQYSSSSLWTTDFDGMSRKTVLKLLLDKFGPKSIEMQNAIIHDQGVQEAEQSNPQYPDNPQGDFVEHVVVDDKEIHVSSKKQESASNINDAVTDKIANPKPSFKIPAPEEPIVPEGLIEMPDFRFLNMNDAHSKGRQLEIINSIRANGFNTYDDLAVLLARYMVNVPTRDEFVGHATDHLLESIKGWVKEENSGL